MKLKPPKMYADYALEAEKIKVIRDMKGNIIKIIRAKKLSEMGKKLCRSY